MRYAILSDIHANAEALERVLADARANGAEMIICLGDIVGYGPRPAEALRKIRAVASLVLAGNHDDAVTGRMDDSDFINLAAEAVRRHRGELDAKALDWLRALPHLGHIEGAVLSHGDFTSPEDFLYIDDDESAAANFKATTEPLLFVGHTHIPRLHLIGSSGAVHDLPPQDFTLEPGKRYIINVGSVGYPREQDGRCLSSYVIYDSTARTVVFRFLPFSLASMLQRGTAKRNRKPYLLIATALVLGLVAGLVLALREPAAESPASAPIQVKESAPLFARKTLPLGTGKREVRANLEVAGDPLQLTIVFKDATDRTLARGESLTVRHKSHRRFKVPAEATAAVFELRKVRAEDDPKLLLFEPELVRLK